MYWQTARLSTTAHLLVVLSARCFPLESNHWVRQLAIVQVDIVAKRTQPRPEGQCGGREVGHWWGLVLESVAWTRGVPDEVWMTFFCDTWYYFWLFSVFFVCLVKWCAAHLAADCNQPSSLPISLLLDTERMKSWYDSYFTICSSVLVVVSCAIDL